MDTTWEIGKIKIKKPKLTIGYRIIKSSISVVLCFLVYVLRGYQGIPFYTALAALQCMQPYRDSTKNIAIIRISGTFIGAFYGLITIAIQYQLLLPNQINEWAYYLLVAFCVIFVLKTAVYFNKKPAAYFSCVVYLCITMVHIGDQDPYMFVFHRVLDTLIGVLIGISVNAFSLPRDKKKDVLLVTGFDDVLVKKGAYRMSDYSKIELNRMLDEGMPFTILSMRTPASFLESAQDLRLKKPLILMNGAVLYDGKQNCYPYKCEIPYDEVTQFQELFSQKQIDVFYNAIVDDTVLIYFENLQNKGAISVWEKLRKSPYRNYINRPLPESENVVYIMAMDESEKIKEMYQMLKEKQLTEQYHILHYCSDDYPGYSYIKIYHKDANFEKAIEILKEQTGFSQVMTIGTLEQFDMNVSGMSGDKVVKLLKQLFEPVKGRKYK